MEKTVFKTTSCNVMLTEEEYKTLVKAFHLVDEMCEFCAINHLNEKTDSFWFDTELDKIEGFYVPVTSIGNLYGAFEDFFLS